MKEKICQNCVDNDEISKYSKMLNKKEQHNEEETNNTVNIDIQTEITTEEKEIENLKVLLEEKENQYIRRDTMKTKQNKKNEMKTL